MKRVVLATAALLLAAAAMSAWWPAEACVGKTIFVGRLPGKDQEVLSEIFSWIVSERTGTTIQVKPFADRRATHSALQAAEIDLYVEDQGAAMHEILGVQGAPGGQEARDTLRREYEQRYNLVWLEPWGPAGHGGQGAPPSASLMAPVIRKDTLKKFPALSRLVNKLAGALDAPTMAKLVQESERRPAREVAKQFLKEKRLI
jgi:osmoprotectant transport system substrate-binding protein